MKRLFTICLVLLLCASVSYGRKTNLPSEKLGSFTGPVDGAAQDDNVKASLDLLHTLIGPSKIKGTGSIFYVDSGKASTAGTSWATAVGTLDEAIDLCTEDAGDIILVAPGHTETLAGADGANFDIAGITAWGLGVGEQAPVFDITTSGELVIGDDDTYLYNLVFKAHSPDVAHAIDVETGAAQFVIQNCRFIVDTEGTDEFTDAIEIAANSDYGVIEKCIFQQGGGAADSAISYVAADALRIIDNEFYGDYAVGCLESQTTISLGVTIKDNILYNGDTGTIGLNAQPCMELYATDTGSIVNNACFCDVATPDLAIVAADMHLSNNTYNETEGSFLEVGKTYILKMDANLVATTDDMFDVAGGAILITDMFGQVTATFTSMGNMSLTLDGDGASADGTYDGDFTTAVDVNGAAVGDTLRFTNAVDEGVLDLTANMNAGMPLSWYCSEGMIEQLIAETGSAGTVTWYMVFKPLDEGVTVTPQ